MKYEIGDRILILHSNEEGEVVDLINDKMVMVEVDNVRFPVYMDQIDFPYFKRFTEKKILPKSKIFIDNIRKEKATAKYKVDEGVWLSFLPVFDKDVFDDDIVESFKLYLINHTETSYYFSYCLMVGEKCEFEIKNQIFPLTDFYIHDVDLEQMNDAPRFEFEFSLVEKNKRKAEYFEASLKIKAKKLFQKIEDMKLKNEASFSNKLFETYPDKLIEDRPDLGKLYAKGYKIYDASKAHEHLEPFQSVVDLHVEKLTDSWKHLSNFEILTLQLKAFEKHYHLALAHHQPSLIIIHGVGSGKLKDEIHEILKTKSEVKSFVNQYHSNFGYGATEIFF